MSYISDIWLYPLHDWWWTVNAMSDFMYTGQTGNFIFRPVRPHDITWKSGLYIYLAHWACQHIGCPPLCTWFLRWRHDFFYCHPGETRNCSNINTHSFHLHSYLPCKPIYNCTRETRQGSPPNVQVGQISSSIQSSQLIHCLFLNWVSHHTAINAMVIIWSGALLPLATELAQWCGHWNHRLM